MTDPPRFSQWLMSHPQLRSFKPDDPVLARIDLGRRRIQSVLDRDIICHRRTLEQKISDQGPREQRVDPQLLGFAIEDLLQLNRLKEEQHPIDQRARWFTNIGTKPDIYQPKLDTLAALYQTVSGGSFGNLIGDALEVAVFRSIESLRAARPGIDFNGHFYLDQPKNSQGRFLKVQPPRFHGGRATKKEADFLIYGFAPGPLCVECKNFREWFYPTEGAFKQLIIKASDLGAIPVIIARRIHYTAITNLLEPSGIIAHESYYQYYPSDQHELAASVRDKRSLGFSDILASEEPHARTVRFFVEHLPSIVDRMAERWQQHLPVLVDYANDRLNLAQLYNAIGCRAAGNWQELSPLA